MKTLGTNVRAGIYISNYYVVLDYYALCHCIIVYVFKYQINKLENPT